MGPKKKISLTKRRGVQISLLYSWRGIFAVVLVWAAPVPSPRNAISVRLCGNTGLWAGGKSVRRLAGLQREIKHPLEMILGRRIN